jgi:transcriptional regulator with PAS, ATPase and Fis domain
MSGKECVGVVCTVSDSGRIQRAEQRLRGKIRSRGFGTRYDFGDILTVDDEMNKLKELAKLYATSNATILLQGETGTGKELLAQSIHCNSAYAKGPFVAVNCAAIPEALLESELFGYEKGAFTGARSSGKVGLFELAHEGSLFLDEIGELPITLQTHILRALQEREVMRIGGTQVIPIDVRIICATNRDLEERVKNGLFRRDLLYRLNILDLRIPPLRERRKDILHIGRTLLCDHLHDRRKADEILAVVGEALVDYDWPGNLRELQNVMERFALFANLYKGKDWHSRLFRLWSPGSKSGAAMTLQVTEGATLKEMSRDAEVQIIHHYLTRHANDQTKVASVLGISRMSLWRRLQGNRSGETVGFPTAPQQ